MNVPHVIQLLRDTLNEDTWEAFRTGVERAITLLEGPDRENILSANLRRLDEEGIAYVWLKEPTHLRIKAHRRQWEVWPTGHKWRRIGSPQGIVEGIEKLFADIRRFAK